MSIFLHNFFLAPKSIRLIFNSHKTMLISCYECRQIFKRFLKFVKMNVPQKCSLLQQSVYILEHTIA